LWQEISKPLIKLGIPQQEIDELKEATLSPEEEKYIEKLKEWKESEDELLSRLSDIERGVLTVENELRRIVGNAVPLQVDGLAKFDFTGKIDGLSKKFQDGTRQWLFDRLSNWFDDEESRVMILTAGPGVGKSVLSAKVCELYKQRGQLAAYHFCDFRNSDSRNPHRILQSLASQMCDNVYGFRDKLTEGLRREHSQDSQSDAFRVLLNNPLHAIKTRKPRLRMPWKKAQHKLKLIIVDALDESKTDTKSEFLELISEKFPELPEWIKIFITSRPELQVRKKLQHLNPVEILPDDPHHNLDLKHFILHYLPDLGEGNVNFLISKCEGSFLYAYYVVDELKEINLGIEPNLNDYVPKGISGFYEKQFKRLRTGLQSFNPSTWSSILKRFVNVIAASTAPLPMKILVECMGVSSEEFEIREAIIGIMSEILPVYEGCLTVYHKSLLDWLMLVGYEEHAFLADVADGNERLWRACKRIYNDINDLSSVLEFQMSPDKSYALKEGFIHLEKVADTEDFHWIYNVKLVFLLLEMVGVDLDVDCSELYRVYKSKNFDRIWGEMIQIHAILRKLVLCLNDESNKKMISDLYLQSLANEEFDVLQNTNNYKNEARDILEKTNKVWVEEVGNESNFKFKVISCAMFKIEALSWQNLDLIALSRDNKLLACTDFDHETTLEVFNLPSLTKVFRLKLSGSSQFLIFSPDSSYLLSNSIRMCISIRDQREVPFIPHGPEDIDCCSFSSCGMRLVTMELNFIIKLWDVRTKDLLVEVENMIKAKYFRFINCNSHILAADWEPSSSDKFTLFDSRTLASSKAGNICVDTCLRYEDNYEMIIPPPEDSFSTSIKIDHLHLTTAKTLLMANRYCSKPFKWKSKKCVIFSNSFKSASPLIVYDFINKEIIDVFHINCFSKGSRINYISNLDETNFLICFNYGHIYLLSFETSTESSTASSSRASSVSNADIGCCALSPDKFYLACCYQNSTLIIRRVDNGETLQIVALKHPPQACWWSQLYLWVICESGVVVKYPNDIDSTQTTVLGNDLEDCAINFNTVLEFAEGVLVTRDDTKISILKICEEKLCPQQIIPVVTSSVYSAAISSDGCAVLLYGEHSLDQLWEITCQNRWELRLTRRLDCTGHIYRAFLTGTRNSRSSFWIYIPDDDKELHLSSTDFSNGTPCYMQKLIGSVVQGVIYVDSNSFIIHEGERIHFVKVSDGKIMASLYLGRLAMLAGSQDIVSSFYLASRNLLIFIGKTDIEFFKIHNVENYSPH
jgi:WD40 repeat protein